MASFPKRALILARWTQCPTFGRAAASGGAPFGNVILDAGGRHGFDGSLSRPEGMPGFTCP